MNNDVAPVPVFEELSDIADSGSFDELIEALDTVVEHLERGRLSITDAVAWYELGLRLSKGCSTLLEEANLRITLLEESYGMARDTSAWSDNEP